ncbi:hypothetical protein SLS60_004354 [Paraconiothyrium brasiliense]|uniref:Uncharacterized protein n=1 Tax=Paraconiothyrium brasiliense TaxID=300254 RepID=A0ABR3RL07_9PLEO
MAPQVSRSEFPWSSPVVIVKSGDVALTKEELADLVLGSLATDALSSDATPTYKPGLKVGPAHPSRDLNKENAELKRALEQCRKREGAIRAVFVKNHEKEQELAAKERELNDKYNKLAIYEARLGVEEEHALWADHTPAQADRKLKARVEYLERELNRFQDHEGAILEAFIENQEKEQQLAEKQVKLEKEEQHQRNEYELLQIKEEALEEQKRIVDMHVAEQKSVLEFYNAKSAWSDKVVSESNQDTTITLKEAQRTILVYEGAEKLFDNESLTHLDEYNMGLFNSTVMKSQEIELLRRHDYYKGWLDAKMAENAEYAFNEGLLQEGDAEYLWNNIDPRNAYNAGRNVGGLFYWSALCLGTGEEEMDVRLDGRQWALSDLNRPTTIRDEIFWEGVEAGRIAASEMFWGTGED